MTDEKIIAYKGFDADLKCRGMQYEIGQTFSIEEKAAICQRGFHACEYPLDVFGYYPPADSRYATVEATGGIVRHENVDTKIAAASLTITAEISLHDMIGAAVKWVFDRVDWKKGANVKADRAGATNEDDQGAASSTGFQGAASSTGGWGAASSTGYRGAASSTGYWGAASSTGDQGAASALGKHSVALAAGEGTKARASDGSALVLIHRDDEGAILNVVSAIAGRDGIKPEAWYTLDESGSLVEASE